MIYLLRVCLIGIYTVVWGIIACAIGLFDRSGEGVIWVARNWASWILAICRVKIVPVGLENIPRDTPVVFMSNHRSIFDVLVFVVVLPVSIRYVAKKELSRIPIFGWALFLGNHIFIDRGDRLKAIESLKTAAIRIHNGENVIMYPEGTRSRTTDLLPFKSGGFHLALDAGVPVLPVSVSGSQRLAPKGSLKFRSGTVRIVFGEPIPTSEFELDRRYELIEQTRVAILDGLEPDLDKLTDES